MHPDIKALGPCGWGFFIGFGGLKTRQKIAIESFRIEPLGKEEWSGRCTLTLKPSALAVGGFLLSNRAHGGLPAQFPREYAEGLLILALEKLMGDQFVDHLADQLGRKTSPRTE
jgi:hypothetical protein